MESLGFYQKLIDLGYIHNSYAKHFGTDSPFSNYFDEIFIKMALYLSVIPLDQGNSPAVDFTSIFNWSGIALKSSLLNSPPLSGSIWFGGPNKLIQC